MPGYWINSDIRLRTVVGGGGSGGKERGAVGLAGSSSILDNDDVTFAMGENYDSVNDAESNTMIGDDDTEARVNGNVNVNTSFTRRHSAPTTSHSSSHHHTLGPMVGHMVDNAINQTGGVGLHSSRANCYKG
jgi:hypothetical protein